MRHGMRITITLLLAAAVLPGRALAQQAATLKLSWDHCAGDGLVADRSFACNVNVGTDVLVASLTLDDGVERADVNGFEFYADFKLTTSSLPDWWRVNTGSCRANALGVGFGPFAASEHCAPWYDVDVTGPPLTGLQVEEGDDGPNGLGVRGYAALEPGVAGTLPPGQELVLFRIVINHSKSTGTGSCTGCEVPACVGFGLLRLVRTDNSYEVFVGTDASAVTWQGAYVAGYAPVPPHQEGSGFVTYHGNLSCSTGSVPVQGRTWGLIKTMYR